MHISRSVNSFRLIIRLFPEIAFKFEREGFTVVRSRDFLSVAQARSGRGRFKGLLGQGAGTGSWFNVSAEEGFAFLRRSGRCGASRASPATRRQ